jgi:ATP-dependent DNA helicase RecG
LTTTIIPTDSIRQLPGITPKKAEALASAGIETLEDLILHFPGRYLDARQLVPLAELRKHLRKPVSVRGKVISARFIPGHRRARAVIALQDDSGGILQLVYFDFPDWRVKQFKVDEEYLAAGYAGEYQGLVQMVQPPFVEHLANPEEFVRGHMLPLYYLSPTLRKVGFRDKQFRDLIQTAIEKAENLGLLHEILPRDLLGRKKLMPRIDAIREAHHPKSPEHLDLARRRLKFEELFFMQLRLALERQRMRMAVKGVVKYDVSRMLAALQGKMFSDSGVAEKILASLPYSYIRPNKIIT